MKNHRQYKRFTIEVMNIKGKITVSNRVYVIDINAESLKMKTDLRLNIGSGYVLHFKDDEKSLKLEGEIEWSSISEPIEGPDGDIIPMYTAGMKFNKISDEVLSVLGYFIEVHNKAEEERLSCIALHIETSKEASLALFHGYKVKKISLGGMLIGSGLVFAVDSGFPMDITLPGNRHVQFMGRIASCTIINENDLLPYDIGIAFLEMPEKDKELLREFIRKLDDEEDEEEIDLWLRRKHN